MNLRTGQKQATQFKLGTSGNPGGRPKVIQEIQELARTHTEKAITALVEVLNNKKATASAIVAAASAILDRGWGKPTQGISIEALKQLIPVINISLIGNDEAMSTAITGLPIDTENPEIKD